MKQIEKLITYKMKSVGWNSNPANLKIEALKMMIVRERDQKIESEYWSRLIIN